MPTPTVIDVEAEARWLACIANTKVSANAYDGMTYTRDQFYQLARSVRPYNSIWRNLSTPFVSSSFSAGLNSSSLYDAFNNYILYSWDLDAIASSSGGEVDYGVLAEVTVDVLGGNVGNPGDTMAALACYVPLDVTDPYSLIWRSPFGSNPIVTDLPGNEPDWYGTINVGNGIVGLPLPFSLDPRDPDVADPINQLWGDASGGTWVIGADLTVASRGASDYPGGGRWLCLCLAGQNVEFGKATDDPIGSGGSTFWSTGLTASLSLTVLVESQAPAPPLWQRSRIGVLDAPEQWASGRVSPQSSPWQGGML